MNENKSILLQLQTGGGKTKIAGDIIQRASLKEFKPVFLTDRIEIGDKSASDFRKDFGLDCQFIDRNTKTLFKSDCYVAMAETFYRRCKTNWFPKSLTKLLFCDEAHTAVFNKILDLFPHAYRFGLTATPVSSSFKMKDMYERLITGQITTKELIERGFLVPAIEKGTGDLIDATSKNGEYTLESQRLAFSQADIDGKVIRLWQQYASDRKTVWFNIDVEHNNAVAVRLKALGISCQTIDSKNYSDDQRREIFKAYERGEFQILLNVGIAVKGWDSPETSCVVYNRMTQSTSVWRQAIGRGGRACPWTGKQNFILIDGGNNRHRLGSFDEEIDWQHLFLHPELDRTRKPDEKVRICPLCFAYADDIYAGFCGVCKTPLKYTEFRPLVKEMPMEIRGLDVRDMNLNQLHIYAKFSGKKPGWAWMAAQRNQHRRAGKYRQQNFSDL